MIDKKISIIYFVVSLPINPKQFEKRTKNNFIPSQNNVNDSVSDYTYRFAVRRTVCSPWWI